jgi:pilus assembly protein CpaB
MSKMRFIAMGVAGAAALGAAFLANGFLNKPVKKEIVEVSKVSMTPVLVALQEIRMGDVLNASNVGWKDWPSDQVRQFMIDKPGNEDFFQKLEGTRARANMFEGEAVNRERIVNIGDAGFMAAVLPKGMRAISTRVSAETGAGGFILPNDRVDVLLTRKAAGNRDVTETVLSNVRVLAIDQQLRTTENGQQVIVGKTATLELEPKQAEILALVESSGQLALALRSLADRGDKELGDDGPRVSDRFAKGAGSGVTIISYGKPKQVANQ